MGRLYEPLRKQVYLMLIIGHALVRLLVSVWRISNVIQQLESMKQIIQTFFGSHH